MAGISRFEACVVEGDGMNRTALDRVEFIHKRMVFVRVQSPPYP